MTPADPTSSPASVAITPGGNESVTVTGEDSSVAAVPTLATRSLTTPVPPGDKFVGVGIAVTLQDGRPAATAWLDRRSPASTAMVIAVAAMEDVDLRWLQGMLILILRDWSV
jgi:hypothetical protein